MAGHDLIAPWVTDPADPHLDELAASSWWPCLSTGERAVLTVAIDLLHGGTGGSFDPHSVDAETSRRVLAVILT